jgi:hypothetical protein
MTFKHFTALTHSLALRSRCNPQSRATSVSVKVSNDGETWSDVQCGAAFAANGDQNTKMRILFRDPVRARYVRVYPQKWQAWPSLRAGVLICERPCEGGKLVYDFTKGSFLSQTNGPALMTPWGDGYFEGEKGYRFKAGEGFTLDQDEDGCMNNHLEDPKVLNTAYTILMTFSVSLG